MKCIKFALAGILVLGIMFHAFIIHLGPHMDIEPRHELMVAARTNGINVTSMDTKVNVAARTNGINVTSMDTEVHTTRRPTQTPTPKHVSFLNTCSDSNQPNLETEKKDLDIGAITMDQTEKLTIGVQFLEKVRQHTAQANSSFSNLISEEYWINPPLKQRLLNDNFAQLSLDIGNYTFTPGGHWKPAHCIPKWKVAIIIPFRDRHYHLPVLLRYLIPMLRKQQLEFSFFVVNQANNITWNKGILMNIGFLESMNFSQWDCFVFHDVDHVPISDYNYYGCTGMPKHFLTGTSEWGYRLLYRDLFGGVTGFLKSNLLKFNGFPNVYWGWGGEDDDIFNRVRSVNLSLGEKPSGKNLSQGFYKVIDHHHQSAPRSNIRHKLLRNFKKRMVQDGLNSLRYPRPKVEIHPLYINISVDIFKFEGSVVDIE